MTTEAVIKAAHNPLPAIYSHTQQRIEALPTIDEKALTRSLESLLKYGLSDNYWQEVISPSYVSHQPEVIYRQGLPDISSSRPHNTDIPPVSSLLPASRS
ncbi:hypothetical protein [Methylobacter sp. S3L5C]|uniref:hypothetical protein n=1 Tax=Methylobacter sp. S3L5C TaxID=2839024 RepID=UPI001FADD749|nr:hypothetical protein [Methylobacter sp. S3L5C]UOA07332.1 hypothetical protein KKZ03_13705 [Methylobacter sp. S3L5C]